MKRVLQTLAVLAILGALAGGAVVAFGLYNVSARAGHLPGVSWVLHTTYRNAVRLRAPSKAQVPDLDDSALIELGARHYDTACRPCHAAPGQEQTATIAAMVPAPPHIETAVRDWQPHHLHWIVANGVKMSGMPAWPAPRDDDVWPVVAFLAAVRQRMDGARYAALTRWPEAERPRAYCLGCHGQGGSDHVPRLDIQNAAYLKTALRSYLDGTRASGIMAQAVSELSDEALDDLAGWFAARTPAGAGGGDVPPDLAARGRALANAAPGDPDVPACRACHGPGATEASELFPSLSGLPVPYLRAQMELWRSGAHGGGPRAALMRKAAQDLDDDAIAALAAFYASLSPAKRD